MSLNDRTRINEWFVPRRGPIKFRIFVGLLFLPYTAMCISFTLIGGLLADDITWDRVAAIALIYALGLGISAHIADSIGSRRVKPWGDYFSKRQLMVLMFSSLAIAYGIGAYYIVSFVPLLGIIAILEGFFLVAYNFEILGGWFHNDFWFAISWGFLPVIAGYIIQTNSIDVLPLTAGAVAGMVSLLEIRTSRPYKRLKREGVDSECSKRLENYLKIITCGTVALSLVFLATRIIFS